MRRERKRPLLRILAFIISFQNLFGIREIGDYDDIEIPYLTGNMDPVRINGRWRIYRGTFFRIIKRSNYLSYLRGNSRFP